MACYCWSAQLSAGLTTAPILAMIQFLAGQYPELQTLPWLQTCEILQGDMLANGPIPSMSRESPAFIQFTSGSTAEPRGVMLTHGNLMHNLEMIREALDAGENTRAVFWLPFYHDMGLIGGILEPVYCGAMNNLMSPLRFLQHPLEWLDNIARLQADEQPDQCIFFLAKDPWRSLFHSITPPAPDQPYPCRSFLTYDVGSTAVSTISG